MKTNNQMSSSDDKNRQTGLAEYQKGIQASIACKFEEAAELYKKSLHHFSSIKKKNESDLSKIDILSYKFYEEQAKQAILNDKKKNAQTLYLKAINVCEKQYDTYRSSNNSSNAIKALEKAISLAKAAEEQTKFKNFIWTIGIYQVKLARYYNELNKKADSLNFYEIAIATLLPFKNKSDDANSILIECGIRIFDMLENIYDSHHKNEKWADAIQNLKKIIVSINNLQGILSQETWAPIIPLTYDRLAYCQYHISQDETGTKTNINYYKQALESWQNINKKDEPRINSTIRLLYLAVKFLVIKFKTQPNHTHISLTEFEQTYHILIKAGKLLKNELDEYKIILALICSNIADCYFQLDDISNGIKFYGSAIENINDIKKTKFHIPKYDHKTSYDSDIFEHWLYPLNNYCNNLIENKNKGLLNIHLQTLGVLGKLPNMYGWFHEMTITSAARIAYKCFQIKELKFSIEFYTTAVDLYFLMKDLMNNDNLSKFICECKDLIFENFPQVVVKIPDKNTQKKLKKLSNLSQYIGDWLFIPDITSIQYRYWLNAEKGEYSYTLDNFFQSCDINPANISKRDKFEIFHQAIQNFLIVYCGQDHVKVTEQYIELSNIDDFQLEITYLKSEIKRLITLNISLSVSSTNIDKKEATDEREQEWIQDKVKQQGYVNSRAKKLTKLEKLNLNLLKQELNKQLWLKKQKEKNGITDSLKNFLLYSQANNKEEEFYIKTNAIIFEGGISSDMEDVLPMSLNRYIGLDSNGLKIKIDKEGYDSNLILSQFWHEVERATEGKTGRFKKLDVENNRTTFIDNYQIGTPIFNHQIAINSLAARILFLTLKSKEGHTLYYGCWFHKAGLHTTIDESNFPIVTTPLHISLPIQPQQAITKTTDHLAERTDARSLTQFNYNIHNENYSMRREKALNLANEERYEDALKLFNELSESKKTDYRNHNNIGHIYLQQNKFKEAIESYTKCLGFMYLSVEDKKAVLESRAYCLNKLGKYEEALNDYWASFEIDCDKNILNHIEETILDSDLSESRKTQLNLELAKARGNQLLIS